MVAGLAVVVLSWSLTTARAVGAETTADDPFEPARELFAEAVEEPERIETAIAAFEELERNEPRLAGRARAYIGALTALRSRQTRWPHKKLSLLRKGLGMMDEGVDANPDDIETLFIHGVACRTSPRVFRRRDDARRDFGRILSLLPRDLPKLDVEFVREVLDFIATEMAPTDTDLRRIEAIRQRLPEPVPDGSPTDDPSLD